MIHLLSSPKGGPHGLPFLDLLTLKVPLKPWGSTAQLVMASSLLNAGTMLGSTLTVAS